MWCWVVEDSLDETWPVFPNNSIRVGHRFIESLGLFCKRDNFGGNKSSWGY